MTTTTTFGGRLAELRRQDGRTLYALAQAAGMDRTHLARLESGDQFPTLAVASRLAAALGRDLNVWSGLEWPEKKSRKNS